MILLLILGLWAFILRKFLSLSVDEGSFKLLYLLLRFLDVKFGLALDAVEVTLVEWVFLLNLRLQLNVLRLNAA